MMMMIPDKRYKRSSQKVDKATIILTKTMLGSEAQGLITTFERLCDWRLASSLGQYRGFRYRISFIAPNKEPALSVH